MSRLLNQFNRAALVLLPACLPLCLSGADAGAWDALLKKYVNPQSRVDYRRWKADGAAPLDAYLKQLARTPAGEPAPAARKAELINAYNALTIRWALENYPVKSIWRTPHPFREARHTLYGERVSLDVIETRLRKLGDPRIHGALVCAARSCPPLRREAYAADRLDAQLDDNLRAWLNNGELNRFFPERRTAAVSMIFKWYGPDFEAAAGSVPKFLARYKPGNYETITFNPYRWGLNDASDLGQDYSNFDFLKDKVKDAL